MRRRTRESLLGLGLLLPLLGLLGFVVVWPLLRGIGLSFTNAHLLAPGEPSFVGLDNYRRFIQDPQTLGYTLNTLIWCVGKIAGQLSLGLLLALLLNRQMRFRTVWRAVVLVPWAMPVVVSSLTWRWILDGQFGILNKILGGVGLLPANVTWLVDPLWIWPTVISVHTWQFFPVMYVSFLAGLQLIPPELYEAARLDGAGAWPTFRQITWPLLRPVAAGMALLAMIWSIGDFSSIWTLTQGGPGGLTMTLSPFVYLTTFRFYDIGYGAAMAVVLMLASVSLTALYLQRVRFDLA